LSFGCLLNFSVAYSLVWYFSRSSFPLYIRRGVHLLWWVLYLELQAAQAGSHFCASTVAFCFIHSLPLIDDLGPLVCCCSGLIRNRESYRLLVALLERESVCHKATAYTGQMQIKKTAYIQ
jgi:hypothetical protein